VQPLVKSKVPYDAFKSFVPVALVAAAPETISVHPSVPAANMNELMALARANPGGYGTSPHIASERLFKLTHGVDIVQVPFQGGGPAVLATLAVRPTFSTSRCRLWPSMQKRVSCEP